MLEIAPHYSAETHFEDTFGPKSAFQTGTVVLIAKEGHFGTVLPAYIDLQYSIDIFVLVLFIYLDLFWMYFI